MKPLVVEYLKTHSFKQLEECHGVVMRPSADLTKASLNYDQILTKNGDTLAEQCRGMVIRLTGVVQPHQIVGHVTVVAWPMNRFYNFGDISAATIDWEDPSLKVYEKLDGTMIVMYWDAVKVCWMAGTRSVCEADLPIKKGHLEIGDTTFSELFFRTLSETYDKWQEDVNKDLTYVFELTSPFNRIVVKYDKPAVTLLAARDTQTGQELDINSFNVGLKGVTRPKSWSLRSPEALFAFINQADPATLEGGVVCDSQFNRIKMKNKAWVLSSRAKDLVTVSRRSALLAIIAGQIDDVLPLVEADIAADLRDMQDRTVEFAKKIDQRYQEFKLAANGNRKSFAMKVLETGDWTPPYFNMWEGRASSALEWIKDAASRDKLSPSTLDTILGHLGYPRQGTQ